MNQKIETPTPTIPVQPSKLTVSDIEVKTGYFFFSSSKMSDVYDKGGVDVQISGAYGFQKWLRVYGSLEFLQKSGHSIHGNESTSIWEIPISAGLQTWFKITSFFERTLSCYLSLGPRYVFANAHNHSSYVDRSMNQNGLGGFLNGGFVFDWRHWMVDFFGEYSNCRLHFHSSHVATEGHAVQAGGFSFGGGMGYIF